MSRNCLFESQPSPSLIIATPSRQLVRIKKGHHCLFFPSHPLANLANCSSECDQVLWASASRKMKQPHFPCCFFYSQPKALEIIHEIKRRSEWWREGADQLGTLETKEWRGGELSGISFGLIYLVLKLEESDTDTKNLVYLDQPPGKGQHINTENIYVITAHCSQTPQEKTSTKSEWRV